MQKPNLSFWQMWNLSFGFFGVQIAYALQSANISRIFATLGADPHTLSFFWILPPLMGMIVQPIVGAMSDKTWCKWGRRKPYLYVGALVAIIVMALLPNSGSFEMTVKAALAFGALMLMLLDTSINMAMQPFKMMVGDMVNEEQKTKAYSIQSLLCNAGSLVGYLFPYFFTAIGISAVAAEGQIPDSVTWSFYIGAAILILCVLYTGAKVKEWNPADYAKYNNIKADEPGEKTNLISLLFHAPKVFWQIGLVQFFSWFAFLYMWTYTTGGIAETVWGSVIPASEEYQAAGDWTGVLFAVQAVGSILWAMVIPMFRNAKVGYAVSLLLGGAGFISTYFIHDQYLLAVSFLLIGCAWAAMLALPFALLTNALSGKSLGSYMGLFNCTICLPQIVASLVGGVLFMTFGGKVVEIEVPVKEEATIEVVAEAAETEVVEAEAIEEVAPELIAEAETTQATEEATTEADAEVVLEEQAAEEVVAEVTEPEVKTEIKEFQSGQIVMLVIAGISLILGALAVFGINTRRKE
ncbi:MAG: SLC45 family MFS transporter [Alistipes sp.]|nr:SLC45 family MFS transporter [Alistipes sp.]